MIKHGLTLCDNCFDNITNRQKYTVREGIVCWDCLRTNYDKCIKCDTYLQSIDTTKFTITDDGLVCNTCYSDYNYEKCVCCKEHFNADNLTDTTDGLVCEKCIEDNYIECQQCNELMHKDDSVDTTEGDVCGSCLDGFFICNDCDEYHLNEDSNETSNGNFICQSCFDDNYFVCEDCDRIYSRDDIYRVEDDQRSVCEDCVGCYHECCECEVTVHEDNGEGDEDGDNFTCNDCLNDSLKIRIKQYSYKPNPIFFKKPNEKTKLFMGIELEVGIDQAIESVENIQKYLDTTVNKDLFYYKRDRSVDGFEMVSHPFTYGYSKTIDWTTLLKKIEEEGGKSNNEETCGLHIHVSKEALSQREINKIAYFIDTNKENITKISRRLNINTYGSPRLYYDKSIFEDNKDYDNNNRFLAFNVQPDQTVEFRFFCGTLDIDEVNCAIDFVYSLCNFVMIVDKTLEINWSNFERYIKSKEYKNLSRYLNKYIEQTELVNN